MKKAVVLGASGGMGYAIVNELLSRGIDTIAFARSKEKLERMFPANSSLQLAIGDVFNLNQLRRACEGVDVIFHAINIPYEQWSKKLTPLVEQILTVAKQVGARVAAVDNIYAYGRSKGTYTTEDTPKQPHTKKGKLRLENEKLFQNAHQQGTPTLIAHFPDFYGPHAENTILQYTFQAIVKNKRAMFIGDKSIPREYIYTPDGAKAIVELAMREEHYGQHWNIPGTGVITGEEIISIARKLTGFEKKVGTIGRGKMLLAGIFIPTLREVVEMMYLTEDPVVLSGEKYERHIGHLPKTPYQEGIQKTLEYLKTK